MITYSLDNYSEILFNGVNYTLPEQNVSIIKLLMTELGVLPDHDLSREKHANFKRHEPSRTSNFKSKTDDTWEKRALYQVTKIEKKDGIEKIINDIRICLNKISGKNYDAQRDNIIKYIEQIVIDYKSLDDTTEYYESMAKIAKSIFDIASTNKFYSDIYAKLYNELIQKYTEFNDNVNSVIVQYYDSISTIEFVDEKNNYDKFCDNNKLNDKRKAIAAFIVNLMKCGVLKRDDVLSCIIKLQDLVLSYIDESDKGFIVDEITENIFIFVTMSITELSSLDNWSTIINNITTFSQIKPKDKASLSSRAIFKYMDVLDFIKKNKK
jgi:hypothetical protein